LMRFAWSYSGGFGALTSPTNLHESTRIIMVGMHRVIDEIRLVVFRRIRCVDFSHESDGKRRRRLRREFGRSYA
jgi:hypothetical protein